MTDLKALVVKVDFFEAFFKVHQTKTTRLTYPIPLPSSVAGMFGAMLGWRREELPEKADGFLFGGKLLTLRGTSVEQATFLQMPKGVRGVAPLLVLNEPSYLIAMSGKGGAITKSHEHLKTGIHFLPYGGQNDFFVKDIGGITLKGVGMSREIETYAPEEFVERVDLPKGASIYSLPVVNRFPENSETFYFVDKGGKLILKRELPCVEGIALYSLENFQWVKG